MTADTTSTELPWPRPRRVLAALAALTCLALVAAGGPGVDPVAGATPTATPTPTESVGEKAPFYENATADPNNESWMAGHENPSLTNVTHYVTRLGGFVIGSGVEAQGGVGMAGPMLLGLVVAGALLSAGASPRVGVVGGSVLFVASVAVLATTGLLPTWLYAIALFAIGLVAATVLIRLVR